MSLVVNLTLPVPLALRSKLILVSSPIAANSGAFSTEAFVTCNWLTADAVVWNTICSFPLASAIYPASTIFGCVNVLLVNVWVEVSPVNVSVTSGKVNVLLSVWDETSVIFLDAVASSKSNVIPLLVFVVNLILPVPLAVKLRSILVSPPVAAKSGALDVSAFVTCNWFTAEAVVWNTICSLSFSSAI